MTHNLLEKRHLHHLHTPLCLDPDDVLELNHIVSVTFCVVVHNASVTGLSNNKQENNKRHDLFHIQLANPVQAVVIA